MKVFYISPSVIPSRAANSIHVVNMCEGISQLDYEVILFAASESLNSARPENSISDFYGVISEKLRFIPYITKKTRGLEFFIALKACFYYLKSMFAGKLPNFIISRNLYAALFFGLFLRRKVVYETHAPEKGIRQYFQKWLLESKKIYTVVISQALKKIIVKQYKVSGKFIFVFHDAARDGQIVLEASEKRLQQKSLLGKNINLSNYKKVIGYFGHLYSGRGIDIIEGLAALHKDYAFVVYGGNDNDIANLKNKNTSSNLFFMGHISPEKVRGAMAAMDILLMPYQKSVSVGLADIDTAQWMSPMKMFEYMSVGVPIISSDLPVLKEVLKDQENSMLVEADDVLAWSNALLALQKKPQLEFKIGRRAYADYKENYTWKIRAKRILELLKN